MIWADRLALAWLTLIFGVMFLLTGGRSLTTIATDPAAFADLWIHLAGYAIVIPWLGLRAFDLIATGSLRYRGRSSVRP